MPTLNNNKNQPQDERLKNTSKKDSQGNLNVGFPFASPINETIRKELDRKTGTDSQNYQTFQRGKVAWCRAISNVGGEVLYPTELLRDDNNLGGNLPSTFDQNYRQSYEAGINSPEQYTREMRPPAGITDVSIDHQAKGGALRKATINWQVHSLRDLNRLERSFLSPGVSVVLEWGWDRAFTFGKEVLLNLASDDSQIANRVIKLFGLSKDAKKQGIDRLYKKIVDLKGNYDAMFGVVTNFDWSMTQDGSYECTTEITSKGFLMKALEGTDQIKKVRQEKKEKTIRSIKNYVKNKFLSDIKDIDKNSGHDFNKDVYIFNGRGYVTWRFIEEKIINDHMNVVSDTGLEFPKMNSEGVYINNLPVLRTTDLDVCLITNGITIPGKTDGGGNFDSDGTDHGKVRNIWVEVKVIEEAFNKSETLREAIEYMLSQINSACNNFWNFDIQTYPDNGDMYVIDKDYTGEKDISEMLENKRENVYTIKTFSEPGNASSINLQSKLSDKVQVTVLYGRNKEKDDSTVMNSLQDSAAKLFRGQKDRVIGTLDLENPKEETGEEDKTEEEPTEFYDSVDWFWSDRKNEPLYKYYPKPPEGVGRGAGYGALGPPTSTNPAIRGLQSFVSAISEKVVTPSNLLDFLLRTHEEKNPEDQTENNVIVPVELEIEIDGVSGLRIGDVLHIDTLPNVYKESGVFQVVGISEAISNNRWTKTLKCQFRLSTKHQSKYEDKITKS